MSQARYRIRAQARRDLDAHTDYLLVEAGEAIAKRFAAATRASFKSITLEPGMGTAVPSNNPRVSGIRKWRIKGFPKVLIFYQTGGDTIRIVRVLHASQDWWALLDVT